MKSRESVYRALSSDARKAHGLSPSFVVYDELAQALDRRLYDNLVTGTGARAEPLVIVISTQSSDPHHVLSELTDYGQQLLDGVIQDETFHPVIYAAPDDADIWDESVWFSCNPPWETSEAWRNSGSLHNRHSEYRPVKRLSGTYT